MDLLSLLPGVKKGLEYVAKVIMIEADGIINNNTEKAHDARIVMQMWAKEVLHPGIANISDPFKDSRYAAQQLFKKYGVQ